MEFETFPDAEAVARWALAVADIEGLEDRVYSSIPKTPTYPLATVLRFGGRPAEVHHLDRADIQVDVWGGSKSEAQDIAQQARVELLMLAGATVTDPVDAFVTDVQDYMGLSWQPDPVTNRDRYVFSVSMFLHG